MNPVGKESNSRLVSGSTAPSPATEPKFGVPREAPVMGYTHCNPTYSMNTLFPRHILARTRCGQPQHATRGWDTIETSLNSGGGGTCETSCGFLIWTGAITFVSSQKQLSTSKYDLGNGPHIYFPRPPLQTRLLPWTGSLPHTPQRL